MSLCHLFWEIHGSGKTSIDWTLWSVCKRHRKTSSITCLHDSSSKRAARYPSLPLLRVTSSQYFDLLLRWMNGYTLRFSRNSGVLRSESLKARMAPELDTAQYNSVWADWKTQLIFTNLERVESGTWSVWRQERIKESGDWNFVRTLTGPNWAPAWNPTKRIKVRKKVGFGKNL